MIDCLIIGGDGLIGRALGQHLTDAGKRVAVTTRRQDAMGEGHIHLDLSRPAEEWLSLPSAECWVFCAAVSRLSDCRANPAYSHKINVEAPATLARQGMEVGTQIVFLSSNQVFDGTVSNRAVDDKVCPQSVYGRQKAEAERRLLELGKGVSVLRMTKVLESKSALINSWIHALRDDRPIRPYRDMVFSPVSLSNVIEILGRIIQQRMTGILQVSGPRDISYGDAAKHIAGRLGAGTKLIRPISAAQEGFLPEEMPSHTTLDTRRLTANVGVTIPDAIDVLDAVYGLP